MDGNMILAERCNRQADTHNVPQDCATGWFPTQARNLFLKNV
ncbi:hypothetical protein L798_00867 [Zootermopsis nevadensis]|uniref:Uncharacterized protein n=1 Tax=Zootermopsis nevadensis TaxID=136037 RepID=A0A067QKP1_ZOONE|nr:hypothetical protein L798_00867 [Zootermopsis nevadensis]